MSFLAPLAFLAGLLAIPIILLYMLRLRRREVTVSSTFLWRQVLQDREANTPWQRLRRNLLLLLQLLILALLVLALARPFITVPAVSAGQVTLLLDASASMNATDSGGETRFEAAQEEALNIVETLSAGDRMTVIRVADVPEVLASSTTDRGELRRAITNAAPSPVESDWEAALNLAAAGSAEAEDFTIVVIGDGGLPSTVGLPGIDGDLSYIPVGEASDNVALTALATRARGGEQPQLFAQVTNYGDQDAQVVFSLDVDGELFASENETVAAGASRVITSSQLPADFSTLAARVRPSVNATAPDYLDIDNEAFAVSGQGGERRVLLVSDGSLFIEQVLNSLPGLDVVQTGGGPGLPTGYDIYIFDNAVPDELPEGDLLFLNPTSSTALFQIGAEDQAASNPRIVAPQTNPLVSFLDVDQLNVRTFNQISGVEWAEPIIRVDGGPLLLAGEVAGRQVAVMPFDIRESDLPLQIAWPVLMANLMEWFTPRASITVEDSLRVGESLAVSPPFEADAVRVIPPEGDPETLPIERGTVIYAGADTPGLYTLEVLSGGEVLAREPFAVNLFSELESEIAPVPLNDFQIQGTSVVRIDQEELGQREYWPWIALLALAVLAIEWYVYHRRMRVRTLFAPVSGRRQPAAG